MGDQGLEAPIPWLLYPYEPISSWALVRLGQVTSLHFLLERRVSWKGGGAWWCCATFHISWLKLPWRYRNGFSPLQMIAPIPSSQTQQTAAGIGFSTDLLKLCRGLSHEVEEQWIFSCPRCYHRAVLPFLCLCCSGGMDSEESAVHEWYVNEGYSVIALSIFYLFLHFFCYMKNTVPFSIMLTRLF